MPQETVGYVELEWTCVHCGTKNEGTRQVCISCHAPMADSAKFNQSGKGELITDKDLIAKAEKGPDVNCPYCGTRNIAEAPKCVHCGGDLTDAATRSSGEVLGAFQSGPQPDVKCPACGTMNPAGASKCNKCGSPLGVTAPVKPQPALPAKSKGIGIIPIVIIGLIIVACLAFVVLSARSSSAAGNVQSVSWQRSIDVMKQQPVNHTDWKDNIPAGAKVGACTQKVRSTQDTPAQNAVKVCGTAYTVNQGNGAGKVVKDCVYQVMADSCAYSTLEWVRVDAVVAKGSDLNPVWPDVASNATQRPGSKVETYTVTFLSNDKTYTYSPSTQQEFSRFTNGSKWKLTINGLNVVTKVESAP